MSGGFMAEIRSLYPDDLLTNKQAAAYAEVAESTIRQWDRRGLLKKAIPARDRKNPNLYAKPDIDEAKRQLAEAEAAREAAYRELITPGEAPPLPAGARAA